MRKEFLKLIAIAVFFSGMEIAANAQELSNYQSQVAQVNQVEQLDRLYQQIDLVFPSVAEVILKNPANESKSGRLVSINDRQIQLEIAGETSSIDVDNVKHIFFRGYVLLDGRKVVIRGSQNINLGSSRGKLSNLELIDPIEGTARFEFTSISDLEELSQDYYYIVDEMNFESPNTIEIKYKLQP